MTPRKQRQQAHSGSPSTGEPEYLLVGWLRRPHGVRGEMLMQVITDFPERLTSGVEVFVGQSYRSARIVARRHHNQGLIVQFEGHASRESVEMLRNQPLFVRTSDRPALPQGQYYHHELLGSTVIDEQGTLLGTLVEILQTGANDVFVVRREEHKELLLPVIPDVILQIEPSTRTITVRVPAGLEESPQP